MKSKSPVDYIAPSKTTPSYMVLEDKSNRPKSSGVLINSSSNAIHRVKYTAHPFTTSKPKPKDNESTGDKAMSRNISFYGQ